MWVNTGQIDWDKPIVYWKIQSSASIAAKPAILISKNEKYTGDYKENFLIAVLSSHGGNTEVRDQSVYCDPQGKIAGVRCIFNTFDPEVPAEVIQLNEKVKEQLEEFASTSKELGTF